MTILYGTHLSVLVKQVLKKDPSQPLSAKEVAAQLACLPHTEQKNLIRRVRRSLNEMVFYGEALKSSRHVKNVVEHTFQIQELCLTKS